MIRITTTKRDIICQGGSEEIGAIINSIEVCNRTMVHLPENLFPNTHIAKSQIICITLEKDDEPKKPGRPIGKKD